MHHSPQVAPSRSVTATNTPVDSEIHRGICGSQRAPRTGRSDRPESYSNGRVGRQPPRMLRSCARRSGTIVQLTQRPTFSLVIRPASARIERWCDTVDWVLPTGSSRSQLHAVPSGAAAMSESSRRRTGSARALNAARPRPRRLRRGVR